MDASKAIHSSDIGSLQAQDLASRACTTCRKRKGKCDRVLPACTFCQSKSWPCDYYYPCPAVAVASASLPPIGSFPRALFLDHDVFKRSLMEFPLTGYDIPEYASLEIGDFGQRRMIATQFFSTIHLWMPIVSKQRFFSDLLNPLTIVHSDIALLCLSMKLVMLSPHAPDFHPPTYLAARQFLQSVTISRTLTLPILQAAILIAIYEIGHAIYPAAYMSVNICVQHAIAMGLGWKTVRWGENHMSWVETEERTRVWWAIVILERYICLGWPRRPIVTEGPRGDELLPCDDTAWDEGLRTPSYAMTSSSPADLSMGPFARLAQATYLLDQVLRHIGDTAFPERDEEAIQLDQALRALAAFTVNETTRRKIKLCCYTALCNSAMALLHRPYLDRHNAMSPISCISKRRFRLAKDAMDTVASEFLNESIRFLCRDAPSYQTTSPFILHWGYEASVHLKQLAQAGVQDEPHLALEEVQKALRNVNSRWNAAGAYLDILQAQQV